MAINIETATRVNIAEQQPEWVLSQHDCLSQMDRLLLDQARANFYDAVVATRTPNWRGYNGYEDHNKSRWVPKSDADWLDLYTRVNPKVSEPYELMLKIGEAAGLLPTEPATVGEVLATIYAFEFEEVRKSGEADKNRRVANPELYLENLRTFVPPDYWHMTERSLSANGPIESLLLYESHTSKEELYTYLLLGLGFPREIIGKVKDPMILTHLTKKVAWQDKGSPLLLLVETFDRYSEHTCAGKNLLGVDDPVDRRRLQAIDLDDLDWDKVHELPEALQAYVRYLWMQKHYPDHWLRRLGNRAMAAMEMRNYFEEAASLPVKVMDTSGRIEIVDLQTYLKDPTLLSLNEYKKLKEKYPNINIKPRIAESIPKMLANLFDEAFSYE